MNNRIDKKEVNGVITINGLSFLEFSREFYGFEIENKRNGFKVPKFLLYWKGSTISEIKSRYILVRRKQRNDF